MRSYVLASGLVFLGIAVAHAARLVIEGMGPLKEPAFLVTSLISLGLAAWALSVFRKL